MKWDDIPDKEITRITWSEFVSIVKSEELDLYTHFEINPSAYNVEYMVGIIDNTKVIISGERGSYGIKEYPTPEEAYGAALDTLRFRKKLAVSAGQYQL